MVQKNAQPAQTRTGFDEPLHAAIAQWTGGVSPIGLNLAYLDWLSHLMLSPDTQIDLANLAFQNAVAPAVENTPPDRRFSDPAWRSWPFNRYAQNLRLAQQWWRRATTGIPGVAKHHEDVVSFAARQLVDVASPTNFALTNPLVLQRTFDEGGANFVRGAVNAVQDLQRTLTGAPPAGSEAFQIGRDVAATPGKVVFRNRLIELIQYAPTTAEVYPEPILIMSAWIMKYYILDLTPQHSLIRYLVDRGHTVFAISWKNPTADDRDLCFDDYRELGFLAALDTVGAIVPGQPVHAVGYCLGGTLLAIGAAAMARDGDIRLAGVTLFAAQTDLTEAGELLLFTDADEVDFLADSMAQRGYLDSKQMAAAFQLLRSNDLIWSAMVQEYLLGERPPMTDLMAWNADGTRMPARMHAEYLRSLFVNNDLAEGRFCAAGRPITLRDIRTPVFAVSTTGDHVAPWRSVYKIHELTSAEVTFVLSSGGHNVGIVNPPGQPNRSYQLAVQNAAIASVDAQTWQSTAARHEGSWWPAWADWLVRLSGQRGPLPPLGMPGRDAALGDAPGTYVRQS